MPIRLMHHVLAFKRAWSMLLEYRSLAFWEFLLSSLAFWLPWLLMTLITPLQTWVAGEASNGVYVFFNNNTSQESVEKVEKLLNERFSLEHLLYHDKTSAWQELIESLSLPGFVNQDSEDLMPTYLSVRFQNPLSEDDFQELNQLKNRDSSIEAILYDKKYNETLVSLLSKLQWARWLSLVIGMMTFLALFTLSTQFLLARKQKELLLYYLLGAERAHMGLHIHYYLMTLTILSLLFAALSLWFSVWILNDSIKIVLGFSLKPTWNEALWVIAMAFASLILAYIVSSSLTRRLCRRFERRSVLYF